MKAFKTFEIGTIKRQYFLLNNKKALSLGWIFCIEVVETNSENTLVIRDRYYTNSELGIQNGLKYWSKYTRQESIKKLKNIIIKTCYKKRVFLFKNFF